MRRLLNTMYVTTQGSYLSREGETVLVRVGEETKVRVPVIALEGVVCFGNVMASPHLMGLCAESGIGMSFLTEQGRFLARVQGPVSGNVLLRREQYRRADDGAASTAVARLMVAAKAGNCRTALLRGARETADQSAARVLSDAAARIKHIIADLERATTLDAVRGCEGEAAREYFGAFDALIVAQKETFFFRERSRRPPLDNVNALLSFVYSLLVHDVTSALETVGLDPAVGFLHRDRPGRAGLALDLMEEFRAYLGDRLALSLVNRRQVAAEGFAAGETGGVLMDDKTRKTVLTAWQMRKQEEITHPYLGERIEAGLLPYAQAMLMARTLRGDLEAYPPFVWK